MTSWVSKGEWRATEPVERFKTLLDQTMTITVAGPPSREAAADAPEWVRAASDRGIGVVTGELSRADWPATGDGGGGPGVQTRWGLPDGTLTDPVMLGSTSRLALAGVCAFALLAAIGGIIGLAAAGRHGAAPYVALAVLAGLALVAAVFVTMGLKSVTIRSGSGS